MKCSHSSSVGLVGTAWTKWLLVPKVRIASARLLENAELADELHVETRLLEQLALHRVLDCLARLDAAAGHDSGVVRLLDGVEDEKLVGPGDRMLPGDVDDDSGPDDQCDFAAHLRLVGALGGLVALERFLRVDVADRGVGWDEPLGGLHAEPLREHRAERDHLHVPEAGKGLDPLAQVRGIARLAPEPGRVAAVLLLDEGAELLHPRGHRAGEPVDGRLLTERGLDLGRIEMRDLQRPEPLLDFQRAQECGLNRHLLVEREPDQKRQRVGRDELVRLVAVGVVEPVGADVLMAQILPLLLAIPARRAGPARHDLRLSAGIWNDQDRRTVLVEPSDRRVRVRQRCPAVVRDCDRVGKLVLDAKVADLAAFGIDGDGYHGAPEEAAEQGAPVLGPGDGDDAVLCVSPVLTPVRLRQGARDRLEPGSIGLDLPDLAPASLASGKSLAKAMDFGPHTGAVLSPVWVICFGSPPVLSTTKRSVLSMPDVLTAGLARAYTICFPSGEKLPAPVPGPTFGELQLLPAGEVDADERLLLTARAATRDDNPFGIG